MRWRAIYPRFEEGRLRAGNLTSNGSRSRSYPPTARLFPKPSTLPHLRVRSWHESDLPTDVFEVRLLGGPDIARPSALVCL
jgi:hypothetical protein